MSSVQVRGTKQNDKDEEDTNWHNDSHNICKKQDTATTQTGTTTATTSVRNMIQLQHKLAQRQPQHL